MNDKCKLLNIDCYFHVNGVCTVASGNELTDGYGYIENLKQCPLHKPGNFKSPTGKKKALMRKKAYEAYRKNMEG